MKIKGEAIGSPSEQVVVFTRGDRDIVIKARPLLKEDYDLFDKMVPEPKPGTIRKPNQKPVLDFESKGYLAKLEKYAEKRTSWMMIRSLSATPDIEWEQVDMSDPATWHLYEKELTDSGFSMLERGRIMEIIITACGLDCEKIEEATQAFLATQDQAQEE